MSTHIAMHWHCMVCLINIHSPHTPRCLGIHAFVSQMLVDDIGDVTITNDGATILKLLEVEHPAARVRVLMPPIGRHQMIPTPDSG